MKKHKLINKIGLLGILPFIVSCQNNNAYYQDYINNKQALSLDYYEQLILKGPYMKGLELYCYNYQDNYYSILMLGTNRLKNQDEIIYLQDNYFLSIESMKEIISLYPKQDEISLMLINYHPSEDELSYCHQFDDSEEYLMLASYFDL